MTITVTLIGGLISSVTIERRPRRRPLSDLAARLLSVSNALRRAK